MSFQEITCSTDETAHVHMMAKDNDFLEPQWSRGPILPPSMVDILEKSDVDEEIEEQEDELDDYDELMAFLDEDNEW